MKVLLRNNWPIFAIILLVVFFFREFFWTGKLVYGQDVIGLNYPIERFITDSFKSGEWPLWNPYSASGYPFLPGSSVFYPLNIIFRILPLNSAFSLTYIIHFAIAAFSMYALSRYFRLSQIASFIAAISFSFSGFFVSRVFAGHYMLIESLSWFPLFFLFLDKVLAEFKVKDLLIASVLASLVLLPGHPQPFIYLCFFSFIYTLGHIFLFPPLKIKKLLTSLSIFIITSFLSAAYLIPTVEGVIFSQRGEKISWTSASEHSLSPKQLINFLLPDFYGNPSSGNYRGGALYNEVAFYIGIIPLILALFTLTRIKDKRILLWWGVVGLAIFLAFGKHNPVYRLLYELIPGFSNARIPARLTWMAVVSLPLLSGWGFDLIRSKFAYLKERKPLLVILGLIIFDLFFYGSKSVIYTKGEDFYPEDEVVKFLKGDKEVYFRNYFLGYNIFHDRGNVLKIFETQSEASLIAGVYGKLLDRFQVRDPILDQAKERAIIRNNNSRLLDLLNVKYLIPEGGFPDSEVIKRVTDLPMSWFTDFDKRFPTKQYQKTPIFLRIGYLPRAFIVHQGKLFETQDKLFQSLTDYERGDDLSKVALFEKDEKDLKEKLLNISNKDKDEQEVVEIKEYKNNSLKLHVKAETAGFLVLSEIYYPGWRAFLGQREVPIYKTNFAFRGLFVPEGEHDIKFIFDPSSFKMGSALSLASLLVILSGLGLLYWRERGVRSQS